MLFSGLRYISAIANSAWLAHFTSRRAALKCFSASRGLFRYLAAAAAAAAVHMKQMMLLQTQ
jgi:hypothetical protein